MSEFNNRRTVNNSQKSHPCEWCPEEIAIGEPSVNYSGKNDGEIFSAYFHPECEAVIGSYRDATGDDHWDDYNPQLQERGKPYAKRKPNS